MRNIYAGFCLPDLTAFLPLLWYGMPEERLVPLLALYFALKLPLSGRIQLKPGEVPHPPFSVRAIIEDDKYWQSTVVGLKAGIGPADNTSKKMIVRYKEPNH